MGHLDPLSIRQSFSRGSVLFGGRHQLEVGPLANLFEQGKDVTVAEAQESDPNFSG
jgi:hypothetical protein